MLDYEKNTIGEKLKEYFNKLGYTQQNVASKLGVTQAAVSALLNGKPFGKKLAQKWGDIFGLKPNWLLTGEGEMLKNGNPNGNLNGNLSQEKGNPDSEKAPIIEAQIINPNIMYVPMVSQYAYAGYLSGFGDAEYIENLPVIPFFVDHQAKGNYMCFEVRGDSMYDGTEDSILEGDRLLCRKVQIHLWSSKLHIKKWDFVIVHNTEGVLIKRIIKHNVETGELVIHSLNSEYPDKVLLLSDIAQIFNVIEISRPRKR